VSRVRRLCQSPLPCRHPAHPPRALRRLSLLPRRLPRSFREAALRRPQRAIPHRVLPTGSTFRLRLRETCPHTNPSDRSTSPAGRGVRSRACGFSGRHPSGRRRHVFRPSGRSKAIRAAVHRPVRGSRQSRRVQNRSTLLDSAGTFMVTFMVPVRLRPGVRRLIDFSLPQCSIHHETLGSNSTRHLQSKETLGKAIPLAPHVET
jgi:hypothetical protein